jgi:putative Holliday junction resolvase
VERLLAIDLGERRIGLAYADPGGTFALPAGFLEVRSEEDATTQLAELIAEENVTEVVVGLPYNMDGSDSAGVKKVMVLLQMLQDKLAKPVLFHPWDERLTSHQAQGLLVEAELKHSGKRRRGRVDAVAASLILQSFLDTRVTDRNTIRRAGLSL